LQGGLEVGSINRGYQSELRQAKRHPSHLGRARTVAEGDLLKVGNGHGTASMRAATSSAPKLNPCWV
jgi:hypothetical protein